MPALAFGLKAAKPPPGTSKPSQKRKAAFFDEEDEEVTDTKPTPPQYGAKKPSKPLRPLSGFGDDDDEDDDDPPPQKSPKTSQYGLQPAPTKKPAGSGAAATSTDKYVNLSAIRSARLQDEQAAKLDASVYDYDAVYETFHAQEKKKSTDAKAQESAGPKYMGSLMQSAEVRKRDQLRAREKALQREREAEGDEFADKEKFVTEAYKRQQAEMKLLEEEEKRREAAEEERRKKGGGMTAFHKRMLEKDEERMRSIQEAEEMIANKTEGEREADEEEKSDTKIAEELNQKGAHIVVNDDGEIVDKRQLLSAGLNVAPKKPTKVQPATAEKKPTVPQRSSNVGDARQAQRERQTRMVERQIEEMTAKQHEAEAEEEKARREKNVSKVSEADKMGARERFLQRKKEREEEARKKKEGG
jgi:hypothetical protein